MRRSVPNNYELNCRQWQARFLEMDPEVLCARIPGLTRRAGQLCLTHFGREYGVDLDTGEIRCGDAPEAPVSISARLNIYALFGYATPQARFHNDWVPFEKLRNTAPFAAAFRRGILEPLARTFTGALERLEAACRALGGQLLPIADLGFQLDAFACIPMRLLFWEGDEEFPAQANLLFDAGATDYIHGESIVTIAALGLHELAARAGLPVDRSAL